MPGESDLMKWPPIRFPLNLPFQHRKTGGTLLGLAFETGRLEGVEVRRTNGSVEVQHTFVAPLSLDLLNGEPELVGREIRKQLEAAGVRERHCTVCLPISWALTVGVEIPEQLADADLESLLQVEAERGFPSSVETLVIARSQCRTATGQRHATLIGVPRQHVARLQEVLRAAQLVPVSLSLGIIALAPAVGEGADGVLALAPGTDGVSLQVACGGGIAMLRSLTGHLAADTGESGPTVDQLAREIRITLGQLPAGVREAVHRIRVFGRGEAAETLVRELRERFATAALEVEHVTEHAVDEFGVRLPARLPVSAALSLAARRLARGAPYPEFLPPRISAWQQFADKYASRKLAGAGAAAGVVIAILGLAFGIQQIQLLHWQGRWEAMRGPVTELEAVQQRVKQFRPWFDDSLRSLAVLRQLAEAFPEDGAVTAKTVEIRETRGVTCTGTARDQQALLATLDRLRNAKQVSDVKVDQMRGQSPMQFTFNFRWRETGAP